MWSMPIVSMRPGAAVRQADGLVGLIADDPHAHGTRTDPRGCRNPAYRCVVVKHSCDRQG